MSGICGFMHLDGSPASIDSLKPVQQVLERRGPDGTHSYAQGSVALGQCSLATTPQSLGEILPFTDSATGCAVTADARLDRSSGIEEKLALSPGEKGIGDGEVILRSYLRWGTDCLDHLRGDFAFAVHDPRTQTLFCARDQVGMRQLLYHHRPQKLFAFATEAEALLRCRDVPLRLNELRIADFFEDFEACDLTSTFFEEIYRLPPASAMLVSSQGVAQWRYWQLEEQPELKLASDAEYAEALLEVFRRSVAERLRAPGPVGSMLSGGMDSGSISAIAASLLHSQGKPPLATFSAVGGGPECAESQAIAAALTIRGIEPTCVSHRNLDAMRAELVQYARECAEPFDLHMNLPRAIYLAARKAGLKVMLDGACGDTTFSVGDMVEWHRSRGDVIQAVRELRGQRRFWGGQRRVWLTDLVKQSVRMLTPEAAIAPLYAVRKRRALEQRQRNTSLSPAFAAMVNLDRRRSENSAHVFVPYQETPRNRTQRLLHPFATVGRERYDRTAAAFAIEPRDPFLDLDVLKFAMSLPPNQMERDGWPKYVLRNAMAGYLPDTVRWRAGKEHLGADFTDELLGGLPQTPSANALETFERYTGIHVKDGLQASHSGGSPVDDSNHVRYWLLWNEHLKTLTSEKGLP